MAYKLIAVEGRQHHLKVGACDDHGPIGNGTHERFIIDKLNLLLNYSLSAELFLTKTSHNAGVFVYH
ncbi:MAG: thioesterase, FlK family [Phascolarctobacterium faecium]